MDEDEARAIVQKIATMDDEDLRAMVQKEDPREWLWLLFKIAGLQALISDNTVNLQDQMAKSLGTITMKLL